jgi:hypothetical protein
MREQKYSTGGNPGEEAINAKFNRDFGKRGRIIAEEG